MRRRFINNREFSDAFDMSNYLTIVALEDGLTASLSLNDCEYCVDGNGNWKTLAAGTNTKSINKGHKLSFRGNLTPTSSNGIGTFTISKSCNLEGNVMSMLFGDDAVNNFSLSGKDYAFYKLFKFCTTIKSVSSGFLPATTLADSCYGYIFYNCTSLTTAPELPATTLADYCYEYMFIGCARLHQAPELPATTLVRSCYIHMFQDCTSLTTAPELPAMVLAYRCYYNMFFGCTNLTTAPALPARTLASNCYECMFQSCTSLTQAPELPATTLEYYCYEYMFNGCTSLITAPELPATTLTSGCYNYMFRCCSKLNYIKAMFTTTPSDSYTQYWVYGVSSTGTFVKNKNATWNVTGTNGIPSDWTIKTEIVVNNYLTIEALEDGLTAQLSINDCEYCVDGDDNWKSLSAGTATEAINAGQTLSFRGNLTPASNNGIGTFTISKSCNIEGNCMSMLFGDEAVNNFSLSGKDYAFYRLFYNCNTIKRVYTKFLPATILEQHCYGHMFESCTSLTAAPELPATILEQHCYQSMFHGCSSLTQAPSILPAMTLKDYCYEDMFFRCTSLTQAPALPATTLATYCYGSMFYSCTSLTKAPELPATTLARYCYNYMFNGCTKLNYIKAMCTSMPSESYTSGWVNGVASTGTFVKNKNATWNVTGVNGIPSGWSVQTA